MEVFCRKSNYCETALRQKYAREPLGRPSVTLLVDRGLLARRICVRACQVQQVDRERDTDGVYAASVPHLWKAVCNTALHQPTNVTSL